MALAGQSLPRHQRQWLEVPATNLWEDRRDVADALGENGAVAVGSENPHRDINCMDVRLMVFREEKPTPQKNSRKFSVQKKPSILGTLKHGFLFSEKKRQRCFSLQRVEMLHFFCLV